VCFTFKSFTEKVLKEEEGVFFSVKNEIVGHKIYTGSGLKLEADFDAGPFPLFSVNNFKGEKSHHWHFQNFSETSQTAPLENIETLESMAIDLDLNDLTSLAGETQASFVSRVEALQASARAGEFWVANFTQPLGGTLNEKVVARMLALKVFYEFLKLGKNHCGGVVITKEQIFCSLSPETFLVQNHSQLQTFPIKGTGSKLELEKSIKEIAELHMITDLMRNDLGQICEKVWLQRERYLTPENNFYHARAEVCGTLPSNQLHWADYTRLLPAGSISGAPKARVLNLLASAENFNRDFYTGTFGVRLSPEKSIFNILIRTLFLNEAERTWSFPVGAGITIESAPVAEWAETLQKAGILRDCLGTK
jgi:para-aminobenzoate synthetase component 1